MTTQLPSMKVPRRARHIRDRLEYRLLVAVSFLPCLAVAAGKRVTAPQSQHLAGESVFAEALSSARAAAGYALMA